MNARISLAERLFVQELFDGIEASKWWKDHPDFVISGVATYIEANNSNTVVIRQRSEPIDTLIYIPPDQLQVLIDRLSDLFDDD